MMGIKEYIRILIGLFSASAALGIGLGNVIRGIITPDAYRILVGGFVFLGGVDLKIRYVRRLFNLD